MSWTKSFLTQPQDWHLRMFDCFRLVQLKQKNQCSKFQTAIIVFPFACINLSNLSPTENQDSFQFIQTQRVAEVTHLRAETHRFEMFSCNISVTWSIWRLDFFFLFFVNYNKTNKRASLFNSTLPKNLILYVSYTVQSLIAFAKGRKLESYQREISLPLIVDTHEPRSTEYDWRPIEGVFFVVFLSEWRERWHFLTIALWYRCKANRCRSMHGSWRARNLYFSSLYFPSVYSIQQCP